MRQLISEILRLAEIEIPKYRDKLTELAGKAEEFKDIVVRPSAVDPPNYAAIDSGYAVIQYRNMNIVIIEIVVITNSIKRESLLLHFKRNNEIDLNRYIRVQEITRAAELNGYVLVDGPITPYLNRPKGLIIGVSKDPVSSRYWKGIGGEVGEWMREVSNYVSELYGAELLLRGEPPGAMLRPVKLGEFLATYIKGDSVFYVEFPEYIPSEVISSFFRYGYPIKLRLAHRYAKISRDLLKTIETILPRLLDVSHKYRDLL